MALTPQQFEQKLKDSIPEFAKAFNNAPFLAVLDVEGSIKQRIFTDGLNSNGTKIGNYKEGKYKQKRAAAGRRVDTVDLEFTGDLRKSIVSGKENEKAIVRINNQEEQNIAGFLTEKYGEVFRPSQKEQDDAKKLMIDFIQDEVRKIIAIWR